MSYVASWDVYIEGDDLNPFEVAKRAQAEFADPNNQIWAIHDLDAGHSTTVDLLIMKETRCGKPNED